MAESRSHEEYRDPDYSQFQSSRSQPSENDQNKASDEKPDAKVKTPESRREAICQVVEREFQRELMSKEQELHEINKRIQEAKELLAKVRYVVVYHYYHRKSLLYSDEDIAAVQKSEQESMTSYPPPGDKPQMAIHPALKKLLGKRPVNYDEILGGRMSRKAAQNATEQFQKLAKKPKETRIKLSDPIIADEKNQEIECKKPRYVAPSTSNQSIEQVNSARGRNTYRHLLAVGNISKYIGDEEADLATSVTHKWLIYITAKTPVPVEQIVSRARFFLHESYKPNDVAEVSAPPFQITKRGWGEFPVRVQIYFHAHLMQKPVQIFHTLVLDKKHTGMQTMGAETIVELWLNIPNTLDPNENDTDESVMSSPSKPSTSKTSSMFELPSTSKYQPIPSTSSQSLTKSTGNYPASSVSQEVFVKQEPMEVQCIQPPVPYDESHRNGHGSAIDTSMNQNQLILPPVIIKSEPPPLVKPISTISQPKICDQNANKPPPNIVTGKKTFIKCVSKDGKVSLMELIRDDKNPKMFRMVLPPGVQGNKVTTQQSPTLMPPVRGATPVVLNPMNLVRPMAPVVNTMPKPIIIGTPGVRVGPSGTRVSHIQTMSTEVTSLISANMSSNTLNPAVRPISSLKSPNQSPNTLNSLNNPNFFINHSNASKNPPKLVAINSPLTPPTQRILPNKQLNPLAPSVRIIQKNNKILVLDPNRVTKTPPRSLLKPQVSLLKPRNPPPTTSSLKKITFSNIPGLEHKNINIFVPADVRLGPTAVSKAQSTYQARPKFNEEFEKRFMARQTFANITEAFGWLLKEVPLISSLAKQPEFKESFPFVVSTPDEFYSLLLPKQRSFEWLRAKYVSKLVAKHQTLKEMQKWSTKEVVLFGRWFGYTPVSVFRIQNSIKKEESLNIRDIVKSEIMREHLQNDAISFNTKLVKWIEGVEESEMKCLNQSFDEKFINVDSEIEEIPDKKFTSPLKTNKNCLQLPIENGLGEITWINEVCRKMQVRFEQEEIVEGVVHRSAELVFAMALRSFLEDLLRKCSGNKHRHDSSSSEINNDDVLRTISTIQRFDFLTNKNLGTNKLAHK